MQSLPHPNSTRIQAMNVQLPKIIFGSSALGNLYQAVPEDTKQAIVSAWLTYQTRPVIDSAGKYGAGLALENIGRYLKACGAAPEDVLISNKLGWKRVPLTTDEPTFEEGAWVGIEHDAVQCMGYDGVLECYEQGNELLGDYRAQLLSIHDPDEYLDGAANAVEKAVRYERVLDSYRALSDLRAKGKASGIGVGSKDWTVIKRLYDDGVPLDWVMFANSFTIYTHSAEVLDFMEKLRHAGVTIVNSAVFNAGFLIGGKWFDYRVVTEEQEPDLFAWRNNFMRLCERYSVPPAKACCQFGLSYPGVSSLALNTTRPGRIPDNVSCVSYQAPAAFWDAMKSEGLINPEYPFL